MQPQEVLSSMKNLQMTSNRVTIAHMGVSHAVGKYLTTIEYGGDQESAADELARCLHESAASLLAFMDATKRLDRSIGNE